MSELEVARLLQSPLGAVAPPGQRGDMVRVSDGRAKVYLGPDEYDRASEDDLRALLLTARLNAKAARDAARSQPPQAPNASTSDTPAGRRAPAARSAADREASKPPSLTAPRRAGRPASSLW